MNELIKIAFDFLKKKIGMRNIMLIAFFALGIYATTIAKDLIVTPEQLKQEVQVMRDAQNKQVQAIQAEQTKANAFFQIQLYEQNITTLTNELYQLKKLKTKKMADEDDLDRLIEVKQTIDSLKAKKDSLQLILIKPTK